MTRSQENALDVARIAVPRRVALNHAWKTHLVIQLLLFRPYLQHWGLKLDERFGQGYVTKLLPATIFILPPHSRQILFRITYFIWNLPFHAIHCICQKWACRGYFKNFLLWTVACFNHLAAALSILFISNCSPFLDYFGASRHLIHLLIFVFN